MIDIVIPTHNCSAWLDTLFESILLQDVADWRIIARDDASSDNTGEILTHWKTKLGERLTILEDSGQSNLGMVGNYNAVLSRTTAPWVMLADPDDVWLSGKISKSLQAMQAAEKAYGEQTPILVCSDATVVDDNLQTIANSYWRWSRQDPSLLNIFHRTIVESAALTSTLMVNRELLNHALPMIGASCPDWWLALCASAFGKVAYTKESTVLYRRHSANDSLTPATSSVAGAITANPRRRVQRLIGQYAPQAGTFLRRFGSQLTLGSAAALDAAQRLPSLGPIAKRGAVVRHRLWFASTLKNAGLIVLM